MTPAEAELMLRQEVGSGSLLGKALVLLLEDAELQNYRQSHRTNDPYMTATICGRGQGINSIIHRITPEADTAHTGRNAPQLP